MDSTPARRWPASRPAWPAAPTSGWRRACAPASPAGSASTCWWCGWRPSCWPWPTGWAWSALQVAVAGRGRRHRGGARRQPACRRRPGELAVGVGCVTLGTLLLVRWAAPFFPDGLVWPAAIAGLGIGVALARAETATTAGGTWPPGSPATRWRSCGAAGWRVRIAAGTGLLVLGLGTFLATNGPSGSGCHRHVGAGHGAGRGAHPGPWLYRLVRQRWATSGGSASAARSGRWSPTTRPCADPGPDPAPRRQPGRGPQPGPPPGAQLRAWLYDDRRPAGSDGDPTTLAAALDRLADEVEADHGGTAVEVVTVGDCPLDPGGRPS